VSTPEQNPDLQVDELTTAVCRKVWTDRASEAALDRWPRLDAVLEQLRPGDTLVVWRLDRLGRSLRHLIEVVTGLDDRGVRFRSLRENIDTTTTAGGRLVFHPFGALAQFEREIIRDRTVAGLTAARAWGRVGGRPSKLTVEQVRQARRMYDARELTIEQIGDVLEVSRTSIYRALGKTTTPVPSATATPAPARKAEPVDTTTEKAGQAPAAAAKEVPVPVGGAPVVVRSRGRSRWFVVQADPADPERGPVAVLSGHTSQQAATTAALGRARSRASSRTLSDVGEGALLQVRAVDQISSRLVWDSQARRASCSPGRRHDRPAEFRQDR
jgi:DNA invertase Pin-like site-specific DNA recombinase